MSFPKYPKYKDSGVEWLGEVPEHWEVRRLGSLFRQIAQPGEDGMQILSVSIHHGVSDKELSDKEMDRKVSRSDDKEKYKKVLPHDLVYNMMRAWQGGFGCVNVPGMVSPAYVVARPISEFSTQYIEHLLRTPKSVEEMRRHSRGVTDFRLRLYWDEFKTLSVTLPPLDEQTTITAFLDHETAKIDALVDEQRRLIELLKEKRQAVISHAVTKGLDPDVGMKDSGVEWLGEVPEHWDVVAFKRVINSIESGTSVNATDNPAENAEVAVLKTSCVYTRQFDHTKNKLVVDTEVDRVSCPLRVGTLIVSRMNTPDLVGAAGFVNNAPSNIFLPDRLWQLSLKSADVNTEFAHFWTQSKIYRSQIKSTCTGTSSSMKNLGQNDFGGFVFVNPPIAEQDRIVSELHTELDKYDTLIVKTEHAITLLQERRTALISAAVTGKIDVRDHAPKTEGISA